MSTTDVDVRSVPHFLNGSAVTVTDGRFADVFNPSTGAVAAKVPLASTAEVDAAVATAVEAQREWAAWNPQRRARVLMRFVDIVNQNADELATLLSMEHGKTHADAKGDIQRGIEVIEFAIGIPHLLKGEFTEGAGAGIDVHSVRQPLGVVAGITPFNFPAMIPLWKAGPALACGNAFILKPSERDPSVPVKLAEYFTQAGLPDGVFQVVHGDKESVDALLNNPDVQAFGFVGSSDIAQYIYSTAAANGKRSQCFGGAKNHMIVMPDANLDQVADALIGAGYGSAGERCMAISVAVPVGEQTAERLRAKLIDKVNALRVGHSLDPKADYGPLVTAAALERVKGYIAKGVEEGAELVIDGRERTSDEQSYGDEDISGGFFIGPTLFDHVTKEMTSYTDEIFGPVLQIVRAGDYEEALALASDHQYGNGVAIFTQDGDAARDFTARVNVGMVGVNVPIPVPVAYYTFGGWKRSGFGDLNQHGPASIQFYTKTKTITSRWPSGIKDGASEATGYSGKAEFVIPTMD
ncbi:CoA-acylating methylmalonate-semialdehyde dehydrogenase [Gordonia sp. PKS22-38]|uniref:methylmalonate-semialdehyde dehydrogenase (CoA acylating) n=1 Tax=Gordonia prachuapensis TaxID=3115651 RepID=A0ABU7MUZ6_9ACTN|nr:CoA-acylating methylmalonate-semialdehyde dehydrogenase [Gordonia sp. PKS22-38]